MVGLCFVDVWCVFEIRVMCGICVVYVLYRVACVVYMMRVGVWYICCMCHVCVVCDVHVLNGSTMCGMNLLCVCFTSGFNIGCV